jgi:hypothetical protein
MGASKPATTTSNQTTTPTPYDPATINAILGDAATAYAATPKTGTYVAPNADQQAAWSSAEAAAPGLSSNAAGLSQLASDEISGKYLDPSTNPYIAQVADDAVDPLAQTLNNRIVTLGDAAQQAGAFGGDRQQLMAGQAIGDFNHDALAARSTIYENNYNTERQIQQGAGTLAQQANSLALAPSIALDAVGQEQQAQAEAKLQDAVSAPWAGLDKYATVAATVAPTQLSTVNSNGTSTATAAQPSGLAAGLQGALGGASAGSAFGPWGAAIGGGIGGLAGLFGNG